MKIPPASKICKVCNVEYTIDQFYKSSKMGYYDSYCKDCRNDYERDKYYRRKNTSVDIRVPVLPNTYSNPSQKAATFQILQSLGWRFNIKKGIWYSDSFGKDKNGVWHYRKMKKALAKQTGVI